MMSLASLAEILKAPLVGADARFGGVSTDTRSLARDDLFVALTGPNFDGHHFISNAVAANCAGALLARDVEMPLSYVKVADTRLALGHLAAFWRNQFTMPVLALTGSNGKTTVKEMIGTIMKETGAGCVTRGNLNNDIGVPLTLLRLRADDRYAVIEMGMNHAGEIEYLTRMARPTIALITNAAEAHLAGLGSVEAVARAKGEIFSGLAENGTAIINADDRFSGLWRSLAVPRKCLTFGLENPADVSGRYESDSVGSALRIQTPFGDIDMQLPVLGKHNVMNALAASAAAITAGASLMNVKRGLEKLKAVAGRLEIKPGIAGARVIDDTYNANPASVAAGLQVLKDLRGERVLVLGDMAELGDAAGDIHARVGELARTVGVERLYGLGELASVAVNRFGQGAKHFADAAALTEALRDCMHADMTVLVKGSRVMQMERVVAGIVRPAAPRAGEERN